MEEMKSAQSVKSAHYKDVAELNWDVLHDDLGQEELVTKLKTFNQKTYEMEKKAMLVIMSDGAKAYRKKIEEPESATTSKKKAGFFSRVGHWLGARFNNPTNSSSS